MADEKPTASPASALVAALQHISTLIRKELLLARVEIAENLAKARIGLILVVIAVIFAFVALSSLVDALTLGVIAWGLTPWLAALSVGSGLLLAALILTLIATRLLKSATPVPTETIKTFREDLKTLKEGLHD